MAAPSTMAMTAYNLLATAKEPQDVGSLADLGARLHCHAAQLVSLDEALDELVKRKLARVEGGRYDLVDPQRRPVVSRNRAGDGWDGWLVRDGATQRPIEEVLP